jgi:decaprenylphospho-beta-D-ribofuranose 2-oxidase
MSRRLASLDRQTILTADVVETDRWRDILALDARPMIARGAGLSYVAASFGNNAPSVGMDRFDRILAFDAGARRIEVEAGVSLGKLHRFLGGHGLYLPVQPGHPQITVGGCIAANVHGKNQFREGTFRRLVESLVLFHPAKGVVTCSPNDNAEAFELTVGGLGLTGIILSAVLRLEPLPGGAVEVEHIPVADLAEGFRRLVELQADYDMLYGWHDLARFGGDAGRGYLVAARFREGDAPAGPLPGWRTLDPSAASRRRLPVFNPATMPWVNRAYRHLGLRRPGPTRLSLFEFLFPAVGKEFYFDFFGNAGLIEVQALVPHAAVAGGYVAEFLALYRRHGVPVPLTTVKAFAGERRLLHYDGAGISFTLDTFADAASLALLAEFDALNSRFGAITSVMKDSRIAAETVQAQYGGQFDAFRARLRAYDPDRLFRSHLSERLGL